MSVLKILNITHVCNYFYELHTKYKINFKSKELIKLYNLGEICIRKFNYLKKENEKIFKAKLTGVFKIR